MACCKCCSCKCGCGDCFNFLLILLTLTTVGCLSGAPLYALYTTTDDFEDYKSFSITYAIENASTILPKIILIIGAILLYFIALAREVQIRLFMEREDKYKCMIKFINVFNVFLIVLSSLSWVMMVLIDTNIDDIDLTTIQDSNNNSNGENLYKTFALIGSFVFPLTYHLIHLVLTFIVRCKVYKKKEDKCTNLCCNCCCCVCCFRYFFNWLFRYLECIYIYCAWFVSLLCCINYLLYEYFNFGLGLLDDICGLDSDENTKYYWQWWSFWISNSIFLVYIVLFYRNPINEIANKEKEKLKEKMNGGRTYALQKSESMSNHKKNSGMNKV